MKKEIKTTTTIIINGELVESEKLTEKEIQQLLFYFKGLYKNTYQTCLILQEQIKVKELEEIQKGIEEKLKEIRAEHLKTDLLGFKILACKIKENKEGYYIVVDWKGTGQNVGDFERYLKNEINVLKFCTVKQEEE